MLSPLAPARRRLVIVLLVVVLAAAVGVAVVGLRAATSGGREPASVVDQSVPGPVLLVPGYGGSPRSLAPLAEALRGAGRDVTVVTLPGAGQDDLDEQAQALVDAVEAALAGSARQSIDLVGYSAGGVVARLYVAEHGGERRVRRLVTLGSPHHGTDVATLGSLVSGTCPTACQQLAAGSPLLDRLDDQPPPVGMVVLSLWTTRDEVVVPADSAVLDSIPSPALQSICASAVERHGDLPSSTLVQGLVTEALGTAPLPRWTPADCSRLSGRGASS